MHRLAGRLIAVEGIDQAGKRTVCERLETELRQHDVPVFKAGFPDYATPLGREIAQFLASERDYPAEVRQLLFTANRWESAGKLRQFLSSGSVVVTDRYIASGIAYGVAQNLNFEWVTSIERGLPEPDLTILLDISPEDSLARKEVGRDAYESRVELLKKARDAYLRLSEASSWRCVDGRGDRNSVWSAVYAELGAFAERLPQPAAVVALHST